MPVLEKFSKMKASEDFRSISRAQHSQSQIIESGNSSHIIDNKRNKDIDENSKHTTNWQTF